MLIIIVSKIYKLMIFKILKNKVNIKIICYLIQLKIWISKNTNIFRNVDNKI
jgi:hypothetical protein